MPGTTSFIKLLASRADISSLASGLGPSYFREDVREKALPYSSVDSRSYATARSDVGSGGTPLSSSSATARLAAAEPPDRRTSAKSTTSWRFLSADRQTIVNSPLVGHRKTDCCTRKFPLLI
jgi:hypothetical protein